MKPSERFEDSVENDEVDENQNHNEDEDEVEVVEQHSLILFSFQVNASVRTHFSGFETLSSICLDVAADLNRENILHNVLKLSSLAESLNKLNSVPIISYVLPPFLFGRISFSIFYKALTVFWY